MASVADALARAEASALGAFWALAPDGGDAPAAGGAGAGPLAGATVAVKDCFDMAGLPTTSGVARDWPPAQADAEAVRRLRAAGAVPLGKAAMDQLAWSTFALAPGFADCLNPLDPRLTPGGSSCGSAVAVAGGLATLALGTDIAGSVRIPAACCGVVGVKPSRGWVPLAGGASFSPSLECGGVIAGSLRDATAALEALAGRPLPPARTGPARVGLLEDQLEAAEPDVAAAVEDAAEALRAAGVELVGTRLDAERPPGMGKILAAELARTWGDEVAGAPELFDDEVHGSIAYAERMTESDYERARAELGAESAALANRLDGLTAVLGPTMHTPAPARDALPSVAAMTACTRAFNALDWAALSVPAPGGRPIGLQLAAPPAGLGDLLRLAGLVAE